jgi:hypothetical protein
MTRRNETPTFISINTIGGSDTMLSSNGSEGFQGDNSGNFLQDGTRVTSFNPDGGDNDGNFLSDAEK